MLAARLTLALAAIGFGLSSLHARAEAISLDPSGLSNFQAILEPSVSKALITTIGVLGAPYAYSGASPLGTSVGLDASVSVTTLKLPQAFITALATLGASTESMKNTVIPVPVLQVHKGLGPRVDLGIYYFSFDKFTFYGGDVKVALLVPEEGPGMAFRFGYGVTVLNIVTTKTIAPELILSRKLDFAEPYLGVGGQFVSGTITSDGVPGLPISSSGIAARSFLGLALKFGESGLMVTLEGGYSTYGAHQLGAKVGLNF
jgi:hypothetical protein